MSEPRLTEAEESAIRAKYARVVEIVGEQDCLVYFAAWRLSRLTNKEVSTS